VDTGFTADAPGPVPEDLKKTVAYDIDATRKAVAEPPDPAEQTILAGLGVDPAIPIDMSDLLWLEVFPRLMRGFRLEDASWRSAAFRLWVERVIYYTTHVVPHGFDTAMAHLEQTIDEFEKAAETGAD
jgi:hypothetical protein